MVLMVFAVGIGLILIGLLLRKRNKDLQRSCSAQTTGEVIRMDKREEVSTDTDEDGHTTRSKSVLYYPVFQYAASGKSMEKVSPTGTSRPRFSEGQAVSVFYDPSNPERFYVAEDKAAGRLCVYFMIFGAALLILGAAMLVFPDAF